MRGRFNALDWVCMVLLLIGGINWGLVGFFEFNLVSAIFGPTSVISRIIYVLVGLSALYVIAMLPKYSDMSMTGRRTEMDTEHTTTRGRRAA